MSKFPADFNGTMHKSQCEIMPFTWEIKGNYHDHVSRSTSIQCYLGTSPACN